MAHLCIEYQKCETLPEIQFQVAKQRLAIDIIEKNNLDLEWQLDEIDYLAIDGDTLEIQKLLSSMKEAVKRYTEIEVHTEDEVKIFEDNRMIEKVEYIDPENPSF